METLAGKGGLNWKKESKIRRIICITALTSVSECRFRMQARKVTLRHRLLSNEILFTFRKPESIHVLSSVSSASTREIARKTKAPSRVWHPCFCVQPTPEYRSPSIFFWHFGECNHVSPGVGYAAPLRFGLWILTNDKSLGRDKTFREI